MLRPECKAALRVSSLDGGSFLSLQDGEKGTRCPNFSTDRRRLRPLPLSDVDVRVFLHPQPLSAPHSQRVVHEVGPFTYAPSHSRKQLGFAVKQLTVKCPEEVDCAIQVCNAGGNQIPLRKPRSPQFRQKQYQEPAAHSMFPGEGPRGDGNGSLRKLGSEGGVQGLMAARLGNFLLLVVWPHE